MRGWGQTAVSFPSSTVNDLIPFYSVRCWCWRRRRTPNMPHHGLEYSGLNTPCSHRLHRGSELADHRRTQRRPRHCNWASVAVSIVVLALEVVGGQAHGWHIVKGGVVVTIVEEAVGDRSTVHSKTVGRSDNAPSCCRRWKKGMRERSRNQSAATREVQPALRFVEFE